MLLFVLIVNSIIMMSLLMSFMSDNPLLMVVWLLSMVILTGVNMGVFFSKWLMYMMIVVYVGGMMVLFSYMVSLVAAKKVSFKPSGLALVMLGILFLSFNMNYSSEITISNLFAQSNMSGLMLVSLYLLGVLFAVVKIVTFEGGSLKSLFNV